MILHFQAAPLRSKDPQIPFNSEKVFVVTEDYLSKLANRLRTTKDYVTQFVATIWDQNTPQQRDEWLQKLSSERLIRAALDRLAEARRKNREVRQSSRQPTPNGAA